MHFLSSLYFPLLPYILFSQDKADERDADFVQQDDRHGEHDLRKYIRRRRHDGRKDEGQDNEDPAFFPQELR